MNSIPNVTQNLIFDKGSAADLQERSGTERGQVKHLAERRNCKDADAGEVKNQSLSHVRYTSRCPIEVDLTLALDDFRSLPEGSWNGNWGAFAAVNLKAFLPY